MQEGHDAYLLGRRAVVIYAIGEAPGEDAAQVAIGRSPKSRMANDPDHRRINLLHEGHPESGRLAFVPVESLDEVCVGGRRDADLNGHGAA